MTAIKQPEDRVAKVTYLADFLFKFKNLQKFIIMKNLFFLIAFVFSISFTSQATSLEAEELPVRQCTTLQTSCGPSGDICGANDYELARNAAWAENYWCG